VNDIRRAALPRSFRGRFLLVVLLAAVVPLALIGVWLTRSVVRAGEDLLHSELDQSLQKVADGVEPRWSYRSADLALLANNEVARRVLASTVSSAVAPADSEYLARAFASVAHAIPSVEYRNTAGDVRWASPTRVVDTADARGQGAGQSAAGPTMNVRIPISAADGSAPVGELIARVDLASLVPIDSSLRLPNGAKMQIVQRATGLSLLPTFAPDSLLVRNRFSVDGAGWLAVRRELTDPEVTLIMAAPLGAYVEPFERAARTGVITLAIVALLALMLSAFVTARLTASLEQLAVAADAVAGGDLEHRVNGGGTDEVGRVGAAFNSMTESLRRTLSELSHRQALAAVGEYAASLSHEVRNALTGVRIDLQHAEEKTAPDASNRVQIARALDSVKRLDRVVTSSLRVARSGRVARRRVDLRDVLTRASQGAESAFAERGAELGSNLGGASAWIQGDALALEELFLNLLLNAAQALSSGGTAQLSLEIDDRVAVVVVRDSGPGIPAEDLPRVLDPFFSTKVAGTGLGLPIARQIALAHGGSLEVESSAGDGTRVEVRLPLSAPV
jgi:signal transduction histidine kinase